MVDVQTSSVVNTRGITAFLIETFQSYGNPNSVTMTSDTPIEAIGIDSFDFVEILFKIEDHYGINIDYNANFKFTDLTTVGSLADEIFRFVDRKIAA